MRLLVDTHLLLWGAENPKRISKAARTMMDDPEAEAWFSAASIWEATIKHALGKRDFAFDPRVVRRGLLDHDWQELQVTGEHALAIAQLPPIHKDPFDRLLVAQAKVEGLTLLTSDKVVAKYAGVRKV